MGQSENIIIIGGGPSVLDYDVAKIISRGLVIGVNDAAIHADVDVAVSMDRLWFENRYDMLLEKETPSYIRRSAAQNILPKYLEHFYLFDCDHTSNRMTETDKILNGTNSGMCAINLAYAWKPKNIWLFGFDMKRDSQGRAYWYPPYPWVKSDNGATGNKKYHDWSEQFDRIFMQCADAGIKLINVNEQSAIRGIPKISFEDFLRFSKC